MCVLSTDSWVDSSRCLLSHRYFTSQPDFAGPLQWGAAAEEVNPHMSGKQGLPLWLAIAVVRQWQQPSPLERGMGPCEASGWRPLHLEQLLDCWWGKLEEDIVCDLQGDSGLTGSSLSHSENQLEFGGPAWLTGLIFILQLVSLCRAFSRTNYSLPLLCSVFFIILNRIYHNSWSQLEDECIYM